MTSDKASIKYIWTDHMTLELTETDIPKSYKGKQIGIILAQVSHPTVKSPSQYIFFTTISFVKVLYFKWYAYD